MSKIAKGQERDQYHGKRVIRRVQVIDAQGDTVTVRALFGPLAGTEYKVKASQLEPEGLSSGEEH